jgi:SAM-dependent methyltransferase
MTNAANRRVEGERCDRADGLPLGPKLYAEWRSADLGALTERLERALILELAGDPAGRDVLDIGCGDGDLAFDLWRRGARVCGIDLSPEMIAAAAAGARREKVPIAIAVGGAEQLPFAEAQFDLVIAVTILCLIPDAAPVFREIARVLRPGGRLVIGELGRWSSWAAARRLRAWCGSPLWRRARFRTVGELRRLAAEAGFAVETVRGAIYYPRSYAVARLCLRCEAALGRRTTLGAAFIGLAAAKPR